MLSSLVLLFFTFSFELVEKRLPKVGMLANKKVLEKNPFLYLFGVLPKGGALVVLDVSLD